MAAKNKTVFVCSSCGCESPKWYGRCPSCGEWNTMEEELRAPAKPEPAGVPAVLAGGRGALRISIRRGRNAIKPAWPSSTGCSAAGLCGAG